MSGSYIATTTEDDVQWLMAAGQSLGLSVAQLRHHLAQNLSPAHGALLAEPVEDEAGRATDWYGAGEGDAAPLDQLPPGPRAAMTNRVWALLRDIKEEGVRLGASADTDERVLGAMLEKASHVPDLSCVRVRGDAPVVIAWAHGRAGVSVDLSALFKPVEVPLPPPPPVVSPPPARRAWPVWLVPVLIIAAVVLAFLWRQSQPGETVVAGAVPPGPTTALVPVAPLPERPATPTRAEAAAQTIPPATPAPARPDATQATTQAAPTPSRPETTPATTPPPAALPTPPPPKPAEPGSRATPSTAESTSETRTSTAQTLPSTAPTPSPPERPAPSAPGPIAAAEPPPTPDTPSSPSPSGGSQDRQPPVDATRPVAPALEMAPVDTPPSSPPPQQQALAQLPPHESEPAPAPRPFTAAAVRNHDLRMLQGCWTVQGGFATAEIQTHKAAKVSTWRTCFGPAPTGAASLSGTQLLGWEDGKSCTGAVTARFLSDDRLEIADASDCLGDRTLFRMTEQCTRKDDASMLCSWTAHDRAGGAEFRGDGLALTPGR